MAGTKKAKIEAVWPGRTSATFTTTKEGVDPVSLNMQILVKSSNKVYDWLDLGCCPTPTNVPFVFNNLYPFTAFRGDKIIISFESYPQNTTVFSPPLSWYIGFKGQVTAQSNKILSNGVEIGRIYKLFGVANDYSDEFQAYLKDRYGRNDVTNISYFSYKSEYWLEFYDSPFDDNDNVSFQTTGGRSFINNGGWHYQTITFQYRNKTRKQAEADGDTILYGKEEGK